MNNNNNNNNNDDDDDQTPLYIGVMSGTSLDGVDVVLASIKQQPSSSSSKLVIKEIYSIEYPIPLDIKNQVIDLSTSNPTSIGQIGLLDARLGDLYTDAIQYLLNRLPTNIDKKRIVAIGNHGQTVWHSPNTTPLFTMQLGDNHRIVSKLNITVVGQFRQRDMALGGQGAPLLPAFHHLLLSDPIETRAVLNIGGIANITILPTTTNNNDQKEGIIGFDTGPGNVLMDGWINKCKGCQYDNNGEWALSGKVNQCLFDRLITNTLDYLDRQPPKSTGRELYNLKWLQSILEDTEKETNQPLKSEDVQRTLLQLTAYTITSQIKKVMAGNNRVDRLDRLLLCGGGSRNIGLVELIRQMINNDNYQNSVVIVEATDRQGVSSQNMEALAFAWMAFRTMNNLPSNLPSVTGASSRSILGCIYPSSSSSSSSS
ncbi:hypothetical protein DFA_10616 [Cavenderia fasciculata]|uniref:Anhydro-N-acetylmuramic acid kinase n=1 Tax=Cavenderia fasciculata TaxID=261658 RepID=F4QAQ4_CACFS|nr:uncharacterized protein DFA_10616 [Cavenderia fasciculata]EGG15773.1 hypothetical protein DFA_10616 [Cavenderia fasciculata]|eukprot:XP_004354520.1 hypothetical protein DFA_10616 [Cavenderia fasciculata]